MVFLLLKKSVLMILAILLMLAVLPVCFAGANQTADELTSQNQQHIYFDASAVNDAGDGSEANPYKYLSNNRIKPNSVIHLADGEYSYKQSDSKNHINLTFIGSGQNTVIKGQAGSITVNDNFSLSNLTIFNLTVSNHGNLTAYNTVFSSSSAPYETKYNTSFGGAIHSAEASGNTYI